MYDDNNSMETMQPKRTLEGDLANFVGRIKEAYYMPRFENIIDRGTKVGWNWPAFFVPVMWMAYRKMYVYAAILYIYQIASSFITTKMSGAASSVLSVLGILVTFGIPMFANYIYYNFACKKIDECNDIHNETERAEKIKQLGGTNTLAVVIALVISIVYVSITVMSAMKSMTLY